MTVPESAMVRVFYLLLLKHILQMKKVSESDLKNMPNGGALIGKREGQTIIHNKGTMGGYLVGKLHKEGGIKAVNTANGQPLEMQGAEVVITAPAVADTTKRMFEGEMLTNREILSRINADAGGVSFEDGGDVRVKYSGKRYNYGGNLMTDKEILHSCGCAHEELPILSDTDKKFLAESEKEYEGKPHDAEFLAEYRKGGLVNKHDGIYQKWKSLVNMSKAELKSFYDSDEGKEAGLSAMEANKLGIHNGRESARWIMKMKDTPKDEWNPTMWEWANRQISFISRMRGNQGALYDDKGNKTRKHTSLLIWGHNPEKYDNGGSLLLAPNGKPSNLTPEQWHLVRTPQFKAWFGDWENDPENASKVIDSNGEPLVVWHTTGKDFYKFDIRKSKEGFFFSPNKERLEVYNKSKINCYFLNLRNPSHEMFEMDLKKLKAKNHDGIMDYGHAKRINENLYEIIAFYPPQIKLADGTNTTFDSNNPDIRYEAGGNIEAIEINETSEMKLHQILPEDWQFEQNLANAGIEDFAKGIEAETSEHSQTLDKLLSGQITKQQAIAEIVGSHLSENPNYYQQYLEGGDIKSNTEKSFKEQYQEQHQALDEFFTPYFLAETMVKLAFKHGYNGGNAFEPSFGGGVFFKALIAAGVAEDKLFGFEMYKPNYEATKSLYPNAHLVNANFEYQFAKDQKRLNLSGFYKNELFENTTFDLGIGNPPYGNHKSDYSYLFPKDVQVRIEGFFIWLSLQKIKPGGLLIFVINSLWLANGNMYNQQKAEIAKLGTLIDAYRLPNNIFKGENRDTSIATDIIIFRKN